MTIVSFIREAELRHIRPVLLKSRYDTIIERIKDGDTTVADFEIIMLSRPALAMLTMSIALTRLSMEFLPDGIIQNFTNNISKKAQQADSMVRRALVIHFEHEGLRLLKPVQQLIASLSPSTAIINESTDNSQPYFIA